MMDDATRRQIEAADPARSTWLTANAGSGKTRVLTDRVARLLLSGCPPERILCLTYTKAAASEMQNRLLKRLGAWAMLADAPLRAELMALGPDRLPDLSAARRLFAQAIETPGGLKVQTIHSFCGAVLRRFPLEAGVPHGFAELDERSAGLLRLELLEEMALADDPVLDDLLSLVGDGRLDQFLALVTAGDFGQAIDEGQIYAQFGLTPGLTTADLLADVFLGAEADLLDGLIPALQAGKATDQKAAARLAEADWTAPGLDDLLVLEAILLTGSGAKEPFTAKIGGFPTKDTRAGLGVLQDRLEDLMRRVEAARPRRLALQAAVRTAALHRFGHAFASRYAARKLERGWLDFDDLIRRTAALLSTSAMAQWVLWRLDGGIDHILVDEAQDTSPAQWQVIRRLTDEFTSGQGAVTDKNRTLFVVGDPKQSIYSFQGADIRVFEAMRDAFAGDFAQIQQPMQQTGLAHSFRSSPAILQAVDAVFQGDAGEGLGVPPRHIAFHQDMPGRVDLWPAIPKPEKPEKGDWFDPVDMPAPDSEIERLAEAVAEQIAGMIGQPIATSQGVRAIDAGDVLILVQRRNTLFEALIRACKARGLPVAGADRLKLAAELAVRDIRAVLAFLATPEDDLSLACALRSPLLGLSEAELYELAHGRKRGEYLWARLRDSRFQDQRTVLSDLLDRAGFDRPYEVISRLLTRHQGRDRLLARLGVEAEDGIDELLSQALAYERSEPPSLTGFLVWLSGDDVEVKRQPGSGAGLIRVMTVHGSKGLESPIVILPDTAKRRAPAEGMLVPRDDAPVLWRGVKDERPALIAEAAEQQRDLQEQERRRLLYVALTRAESWLIVAAAGDAGEGLESWHSMVAEGLARSSVDLEKLPCDWGEHILRLSYGDWPQLAGDRVPVADTVPLPLPDWLHQMPPATPVPVLPVAATALGGAKVLAGDAVPDDSATDRGVAMLRGTRLHLLLELLPGRDPASWAETASIALAGAEGGLPLGPELAELLDEVGTILTAEVLASALAAPEGGVVLTEVALTAPLPGGRPLNGIVDRLIVAPDRVVVIDYKSNVIVPARPEDTPEGILRQMAAYHAALRGIYPGRVVEAAVLWTSARELMPLPDALLEQVWSAIPAP
ncbi:MAG: double-strand break repair helicase AddA [Paracoccus sp. (in: a-proteobacteria)]|uniref:double-strand break repair helicase AddA n=1 Tax=Paracoccus sp. TaxID=267 RepID=UPI0026DFCBD8|nr:double-strand break repair helicase AddA [Paracoccus sp. (in: a-proteobacteria)]MDO5621630.1 double-strand break repair helicase AddA [Paracoccus sp. (in: a-proteobacteria)]